MTNSLRAFLARHAAPCREATRLISERMDRSLPPWQWLALRAHLLLCDVCTRYARQLQLLRQALRGGLLSAESVSLSPEARARIQRAIAGAASSNSV